MKLKILSVFILLQLIIPGILLALEIAPDITDREVVEKLAKLEAGQQALRSEIKAGQQALNQRISDTNQRISDLRSEMKAGQEALRSEMKAGQEAINTRLDDTNSTMLVFFGAIITLIVALFAYIAWDRRTMIKPVAIKLDKLERVVVNDLDLHHSEGSLVTRLLKVLSRYAQDNPDTEIADIVRELSLLQNESA